MADRVLVAPPGLTRPDLFAQDNIRPMAPPPRQANTLVVGGPAYFTPEGYQAPIQPTQSFMPTNRAPDPIRDQFNRQLPPIQRPQPPMPAPQPQMPGPSPEFGDDVGDGSFQDINTDLPTQTGGVGDPARYQESQEPGPDSVRSYIDVNGNLQFGSPPSFTMGPEDSNTAAPEPVFTPPPPPTTPEPNGFFPGVTPDFSNLDFSGLSDLNLEDMDFSNLPVPPPPPPPRIPAIEDMDFTNMPDFSNVPGIQNIDFSGLPNYKMPAPTMPAPQAQAPAPVYTPPPSQIPMQGMMDDYDFGNPNLRNMRRFDPRR